MGLYGNTQNQQCHKAEQLSHSLSFLIEVQIKQICLHLTAKEEYNYLLGLKENYKAWLAQNCAKRYKEYDLNIDKWEASIKSAMDATKKELRQDFGEDNWGTDMDMMIYGAGSEQTYLFLEDLISSSRDWCN